MVRVEYIESLEGEDLAPYRTMRRPLEHQSRGIFVAEGEKVVRRLFESNFSIVSILIPEKWIEIYQALAVERPESITIYVAPRELLETLTGFTFYQGVLAVGKIPSSPSLDSVLALTAQPHLFAAIEGITDANNLGVIIRNAAALGVQALLVGETCCNPFLRRSVRNSMGSIFQLPIIETPDLEQALIQLSQRGVRLIGAHPSGQDLLWGTDLKSDCCLIFGSEGYGLSEKILAACSVRAAVPMHCQIDSLNVGNAAAIFFYEAYRQRAGNF